MWATQQTTLMPTALQLRSNKTISILWNVQPIKQTTKLIQLMCSELYIPNWNQTPWTIPASTSAPLTSHNRGKDGSDNAKLPKRKQLESSASEGEKNYSGKCQSDTDNDPVRSGRSRTIVAQFWKALNRDRNRGNKDLPCMVAGLNGGQLWKQRLHWMPLMNRSLEAAVRGFVITNLNE